MRRLLPLLLLISSALYADSWAGPRVMNVFSDNGRYFVRITPGTNLAATVGFQGSPKGPNARGEFYKRQPDKSYKLVADIELPNPMSPVDALMSNDGRLITFDNWHNLGFGKVVVIYSPAGKVVRQWELADLYDENKIKDIPRSTSSRMWRCRPTGFSDPTTQMKVYAMERFGGSWQFDLDTGAHRYYPGKATCQ